MQVQEGNGVKRDSFAEPTNGEYYRLYMLSIIEKGLRDIEARRVIPHDEVGDSIKGRTATRLS